MIADKKLDGIRPACVSMEAAAAIFGWPNYYLPFLVRAGHLKPLGKPAQNARKWFATVEIERMSQDPNWLDKAIRIVEKQIQEMNRKQRRKKQSECPCPMMVTGSYGNYECSGIRTMSRRMQPAMVSTPVTAMMMTGREPLCGFGCLSTIISIVKYHRPTPMPAPNSQRGEPGPHMPMLHPIK